MHFCGNPVHDAPGLLMAFGTMLAPAIWWIRGLLAKARKGLKR